MSTCAFLYLKLEVLLFKNVCFTRQINKNQIQILIIKDGSRKKSIYAIVCHMSSDKKKSHGSDSYDLLGLW